MSAENLGVSLRNRRGKKALFVTLLGYRTEGPLMFQLSDIQEAGSIQSLGRSSDIPACLGSRICPRTFAVVGRCLHGETFNTVVLKVAAPNLATLPSQRPDVQDYELEESDTKHTFPEGAEDFQT